MMRFRGAQAECVDPTGLRIFTAQPRQKLQDRRLFWLIQNSLSQCIIPRGSWFSPAKPSFRSTAFRFEIVLLEISVCFAPDCIARRHRYVCHLARRTHRLTSICVCGEPRPPRGAPGEAPNLGG